MENLFIITGPTASGKSGASLYIADKIKEMEIISADSMQIYRGMDIGTAKVSSLTRESIPHHLIDIIDPWESYSLGRYVKEANVIIKKKRESGKQCIVVGGTGLYIKGLTHGIFEGPNADPELRDKLMVTMKERGSMYLFNKLKEIDPISAERLHHEDHKRVIRALEVYEKTGTTISRLQKKFLSQKDPIDYIIFIINRNKEDLCKLIDERVEDMFNSGFIEEVKALNDNIAGLSKQAEQALGYKEILNFLNNRTSLTKAKDLIKQKTKRFAKKQRTWFRSFRSTVWIDYTSNDNSKTVGEKILKEMIKFNKKESSKSGLLTSELKSIHSDNTLI